MSKDLRGTLIGLLGAENVKEHVSMSSVTTFRAGGPADFLCTPVSEEQIRALAAFLQEAHIPYLVIGNGSNLLVRDGGIRGVVLQLGSRFSAVTAQEPEDGRDGAFLTAQAGAKLSAVGHEAQMRALSGFEFACGIPGSVGGAVRMNAGAYGAEIKDILCCARVLMPDGQVKTCSPQDLQLSYRHSALDENGGMVLSATFRLRCGDPEQIRARMAELAEKRRSRQPLEFPSAGSTFKRPEGHFAGKLIMDAGLKGLSVGGAQVSEKHAGFVINRGGATAADIEALIGEVQNRVFALTGVKLEPEVKIVGERE